MGVFCKRGDINDAVAGLQAILQLFDPAIKVDSNYGPATSAALVAALGTIPWIGGDTTGGTYWAGEYAHLQQAVAKKFGTGAGVPGPKGDKGDPGEPGPKGDQGDPGKDGLGAGDPVTLVGTIT